MASGDTDNGTTKTSTSPVSQSQIDIILDISLTEILQSITDRTQHKIFSGRDFNFVSNSIAVNSLGFAIPDINL